MRTSERLKYSALYKRGGARLGAWFAWAYDSDAFKFAFDTLMPENLPAFHTAEDTERRMFLLFCAEAYE
jgi:hypothetical protein